MAKSRKIRIAKDVSPYPMPSMLLGSKFEGKTNFMAASWVMRVNANPPMLAVAVHSLHLSAEAIAQSGVFSLNLPNEALLEKLDYCGLFSGRKVDKSALFTVFEGEETGAPMIEECPLTIELKLEKTVDLPSNKLFIGEVRGAYCDEHCLLEGRPDIRKIQPICLTMPDNNYWSSGEFLGPAWQLGRHYRGDVSFPMPSKVKDR